MPQGRCDHIDKDVYEFIQSQAVAYEEDMSDTLRRLLNIEVDKSIVPVGKKPRKRPDASKAIPRKEYVLPLLETLEQIGPGARRSHVLRIMEDKFSPHFNKADRVMLKGNVERWKKHVDWARYQLIKSGDMKPTRSGIWEITRQGKLRLKKDRTMRTTIGPEKRITGGDSTTSELSTSISDFAPAWLTV